MAPYTYEQDLLDRYIGLNRILFLRGSQPAFKDLTCDLGTISPLLSEIRSNLDQLLEQSNQCNISEIGEVSTWERILAEGTNDHEHGNSEGVAEMMAHACSLNHPLTKQILCDWHYRLYFYDQTKICKFPVGEYRGISEGPIYFDNTGFVATEADRIDEEMGEFLSWFNVASKKIDPLLRVAIAPLWFLTVHPFANGNGRISRAIAEMALTQIDPRIQKTASIAKQLMLERDDYYSQLGLTQTAGTPDITEFLLWFLGCVNRAIRSQNARPKS
jgi:Fic family protein